MEKKSNSGNRETVRDVKAGGKSGGDMKQEHLLEQDGAHKHKKEVERFGKGLCPAGAW